MARPKKDKEYAKDHRVTVRFSEDEYNVISTNSGSAGMTVSEYIREQLSKGKVVATYKIVSDTESVKKLAEEYHKIGINLNQIAKHLNSGGEASEALVSEIKKCITGLRVFGRSL